MAMTQDPGLEWTLGDRIRKVRRRFDMGQEEFGHLFGVSSSAVAMWEADASKPRGLVQFARDVERLATERGYEIPAGWILGIQGADNPRYVQPSLFMAA